MDVAVKRIRNQYKNLPASVKASIWFIICSVLQKGIAFFVIPVYTRLLTPAEYGTYAVFISWVSIVYIFATLNLSANVFNNGMIKYGNNKERFTSCIQGLSTFTCILAGVVLISIRKCVSAFPYLDYTLLILMIIYVLFQSSYAYWTARLKFDYKYKGIVISAIVLAFGTPFLSIILMLRSENKALGIIVGTVLAQAVLGFVVYLYNWIKGRALIDQEIWKFAARFNIPLIPHYLSYVVLGQADRVMINSLCGASEAGIYSLAYQISVVISIVTNAIESSFNPWTYKKLKDGDYDSIRKVNTCIVFIFSIACVAFMLIAPEVLYIVAPEEYQDAKKVIPPVILGSFFLFLAGVFMKTTFFCERTSLIMVASICTAVLNILLNLVYIPRYGYTAAAYTTLASYLLFAVFHYIVMRDTCHRRQYEEYPIDGTRVFAISLFALALSAAVIVLYDWISIRYMILLFILLVFFVYINKSNIRAWYK